MNKFTVKSQFKPAGDQLPAIDELARNIEDGKKGQVLLGVTGSGKTFTIANVIERVQKPTLVIAHNKTLAAQLCSEFKEFFPDSAVEYFVSYYDYYQPEAYIPSKDLYIEKESTINDEIDKMRHSATSSLNERRDVIIVSSVSCIYALGDPVEYLKMSISLREGMRVDRNEIIHKLVDIQYERNDINFVRGTFRARGDVLEIFPANWGDKAIRVEFFDDIIERICEIDVVTGEIIALRKHVAVFPSTHYATSREKLFEAIGDIEEDLRKRVKELQDQERILEAQRLQQRTQYDLEMMREIGYCSGIENYSRYFDGRSPGDPPFTLLDYFPDDFLLVIDESHVTVPQIRAMYAGDFSRKQALVEFGFRIPSSYDNRPLKFAEFEERLNQAVYVSATPAVYELEKSGNAIVEQIIRPTGLVDPEIIIRPVKGQVDDLLGEIKGQIKKGYRVLVTTLTKKMAENLAEYYEKIGLKVRYMHSDISALERMEILRDLRLGEFDVLIGINLLREGLDLPEVGLVAILDADKEGFLRSATSLIQTVGRAARNVDGIVIMYADIITNSMQTCIDETNRRREKQIAYNKANNITPRSVSKSIREVLENTKKLPVNKDEKTLRSLDKEAVAAKLYLLEQDMQQAASELDFERAAILRDKIYELKGIGKKESRGRHKR